MFEPIVDATDPALAGPRLLDALLLAQLDAAPSLYVKAKTAS